MARGKSLPLPLSLFLAVSPVCMLAKCDCDWANTNTCGPNDNSRCWFDCCEWMQTEAVTSVMGAGHDDWHAAHTTGGGTWSVQQSAPQTLGHKLAVQLGVGLTNRHPSTQDFAEPGLPPKRSATDIQMPTFHITHHLSAKELECAGGQQLQ